MAPGKNDLYLSFAGSAQAYHFHPWLWIPSMLALENLAQMFYNIVRHGKAIVLPVFFFKMMPCRA
jgi:hypothetical protein